MIQNFASVCSVSLVHLPARLRGMHEHALACAARRADKGVQARLSGRGSDRGHGLHAAAATPAGLLVVKNHWVSLTRSETRISRAYFLQIMSFLQMHLSQ
jgi:hypothetical protein